MINITTMDLRFENDEESANITKNEKQDELPKDKDEATPLPVKPATDGGPSFAFLGIGKTTYDYNDVPDPDK
jgi:hypothetical protein